MALLHILAGKVFAAVGRKTLLNFAKLIAKSLQHEILIASRDPTSPSANQVPEALDLDKLCAWKEGWIAVVRFCGFAFVMCFVVAVSRLLVGAEIHSNRDPNQSKIDPKSTKSGRGGTAKR